jgi:hypothetical protein
MSALTEETGRALLSEMRALREELAEGRRDARPIVHSRPPALSRGDRKTLEKFVPALSSAFGTEMFLACEIPRHQSPVLRALTKGRSTKAIGKLLKRAVGFEIDGLVVERLGSELNANLWRVTTCLVSGVSFGLKPA